MAKYEYQRVGTRRVVVDQPVYRVKKKTSFWTVLFWIVVVLLVIGSAGDS